MIGTLRKQGFILGLLLAVFLAFIWPEPATEGGFLFADLSTKLGVALIFLLQGLGLATKQMLGGVQPARLHVFCLAWNFALFPLLAGLILWPLSALLLPELAIGVWMLSILPTTIASAATLTAMADGAVPQAIFASIFSNVLAVFVVPILAVGYLSAGVGIEVPLAPIFAKLCLIVILPIFVGQLLRRLFTEGAQQFTSKTKWVTQVAILYIVYVAFARGVESGVFLALEMPDLFTVVLAVLLLMLVSAWVVWWSSSFLNLAPGERIAAFFCAGQKSLATGLPLLTSIFAASSLPVDAALVLIPLLLFHPLQLVLGAVCGNWLRKGFD